MSALEHSCLLLSYDYTALRIIPVRQAFKLVFSDKAEIVSECKDLLVNTVSKAFAVPSIIRLLNKLKLKFSVRLSRKNILIRDKYRCQYCGVSGTSSTLTLDHILPRSRGGKFSWQNIVTSCVSCNAKKGDRTAEEANLGFLYGPPDRLDMYEYVRCLLRSRISAVPEWELFIS